MDSDILEDIDLIDDVQEIESCINELGVQSPEFSDRVVVLGEGSPGFATSVASSRNVLPFRFGKYGHKLPQGFDETKNSKNTYKSILEEKVSNDIQTSHQRIKTKESNICLYCSIQ